MEGKRMGAEESKNYSFAPILLPTVSGLIDSWRFDSRGHRQENGASKAGWDVLIILLPIVSGS
jgi:hypothetical protein